MDAQAHEVAPWSLALTIDALPKLPNELQRQHWSVVSRHANEWHWRIRAAVGRDAPQEGPLPYAKVVLVRHSSVEPDWDGLVASWKPVLDGLVRAQVIEDDRPSCVDLESRWEYAPPGQGCIGVSVMPA